MKYEYKFIDADVNDKERLPIVSSESLNPGAGVIHHLLAENGEGKTWLLNYIMYSLVESPESSNDGKWSLSPEKQRQVKDFKQFDGQIEGYLSLDLEKIEVRSRYELGQSVKREYRLKSGGNWSDLSDTVLRRHLNLAYLVPMEPAKRVGKIKTQLIENVGLMKAGDGAWARDLLMKIREASREGRNQSQIDNWRERIRGLEGKIESCNNDLQKHQKEVSGLLALKSCQNLNKLLVSIDEASKKLLNVKAKLDSLPKLEPKPDMVKITADLENVQQSVHNCSLLKKLRKLVALCADQSDSVQRDFKAVRLVEDARNIIDLLSPNNVPSDIDESPFVAFDPRSVSVVRQVPRFEGRRNELMMFFDSHFQSESSDAKILDFLKAFVSLVEQYRDEKAFDTVLKDKLGATVGVEGLERTLVAEINRVGSGNIRLELDEEMNECLSGLVEAVADYEKSCKKYVRVKDKLSKAANHTDPHAAERVSLRGESVALRAKIDEYNSKRRNLSDDLNGFQQDDWTKKEVIAKYEKIWQRAFSNVDTGAFDRCKKKLSDAKEEKALLEGKVESELRKPEDVLEGWRKVQAKQISDIVKGFSQQLGKWVDGLDSDSLSDSDVKFFGAIVAEELGGAIWFDGKNQRLDYVDMGAKRFYLRSGAKPTFNRLSQAQAGEVTFRLLLRPMLENGDPTILLFDEAGDMDDKTWGNILDWVSPHRDKIKFMMKVGVKTGAVELRSAEI